MRTFPAVVFTAVTLAAISPGSASCQDCGRIEQLILQLDDPKFIRRESATVRLIEVGEAAIPALRAAARHPSLEVRRRAKTVLELVISDTLFSISDDGRLIRLRVGKRTIETEIVRRLGDPFEFPNVVVEGLAMSPNGRFYAAATLYEENTAIAGKLYEISSDGKHVKLIGEIAPTAIRGLNCDRNGRILGTIPSRRLSLQLSLSQLIEIDRKTAAATAVSSSVNIRDLQAIAISQKGKAIACSRCVVYGAEVQSELKSLRQIDRHPACQLAGAVGDLEELAFCRRGPVYGICNRGTVGNRRSRLIRFDPSGKRAEFLGELGFIANNLAAALEQRDDE